MKRFYFILSLLFVLTSCSCDREKPLPKEVLMLKVLKIDPSAQLITPKDISAGVHCSDYGAGCKSGHLAKVMGLEVIFVEFENKQMARSDALRLGGLYVDNWLLDDAKGEPILEKFAKEHLGAIDPRGATDAK